MTNALLFAQDQQHNNAQFRDYLTLKPSTFKDGSNVPPIVTAATWDHWDIVGKLLVAGADPNARAGPFTPVYLATVFDHPVTLRLLLDSNATPNPDVAGAVLSPTEVAAQLGYSEVAALLADHAA